MKDRRPTTVGIDIAIRSEIFLHLTEIAVRMGRTITWDPVSMIRRRSTVLGGGESISTIDFVKEAFGMK